MQDDKLEDILQCLERMDRRDRMRTIGGTIRSLLHLIPLLLILWSTWYFYEHSDEVLRTISGVAAEQASKVTQNALNQALQGAH